MSVEYGVTMRKAAESIDDRLVRVCSARPLLFAQARDQLNCQRLVLAILAMLEWHIEKQPLLLFHCEVEAFFQRASGQSTRHWIDRECTWRAPEQVARELIQNNYGSQHRTLRRCDGPRVGNDPFVQRNEATADLRINLVAPHEPMSLAQFVKPKMKDFGYPGRVDHAVG